MPNVKSGTLVKPDDLIETVKQSKQGLIEFRINSSSFILSKIGLRDFSADQLTHNFDALMMALLAKKPDSVKGRYLMKAMIKSSMGNPVKVDLSHYS